MKRLIPILLAVFAFAACEKDPDMDKLDNDYLVYPYVVNYSITTNSFLTEIMNLKAPEGDNQKLPVLWSSFLSGPASYSGKVNQTLVVRAINQSFAQSPYLTNK